jgi:hypothetical protein
VVALGPTVCVPEVALFPDHPPDAVQPVALVADQLSWLLPPLAIEVGLAVSCTLGAGVVVLVFAGTIAHCGALP